MEKDYSKQMSKKNKEKLQETITLLSEFKKYLENYIQPFW